MWSERGGPGGARGGRGRRERTGTAFTDIVIQAVHAVLGRRLRSVLTVLGIALGIAAALATTGITASAADAVSGRFDALKATAVTVRFHNEAARPTNEAAVRARKLNGVRSAGLLCTADERPSVSALGPRYDWSTPQELRVLAADEGALAALGVTARSGRLPDAGHMARGDAVAVVDTVAAKALGLDALLEQTPEAAPSVHLAGRPFTVIGSFRAPAGDARLTGSVVVPYASCAADGGVLNRPPAAAEDAASAGDGAGGAGAETGGGRQLVFGATEAVLRTELGAAQQVGLEAPLALHPEGPDRLAAIVPADLGTFRGGVESETRALFLGLAGVSLLIGALGVSNTTYVSVVERRSEIGLRRAVGAGRAAVSAQFLVECGLLGLIGGVLGTAVGVDVTAGTALAKGWLVVLDPALTAAGPLLGLAVGMLAGVYPALAASRIAPAETLRG
ncbi:FtsX-like permease family protein [Streptomyces sp. QHH-9511]|uniref:ABC transporter permease n=1 Tax=Streptomyces sp. QHH-9511 TaxID=2684468 RepID=UPI001317C907|nr:ABC transporter permease [Streptomyces sp. QHH-9511]QGZ50553.1 FtsX-like permease family protein [Streptomyces sp. QHH-9511]